MGPTDDAVFVHHWSLDLSEKILRIQENMVTAHQYAIYEWKLKLSCEEDYSFLRGITNRNGRLLAGEARGSYQLSIEPSVLFENKRAFQLNRIIFQVETQNDKGEVVLGPTNTVLINPDTNTGDGTVRLPCDSAVGKILNACTAGQSGATVHISTTLHIPKSCFELGKWAFEAPRPPPKLACLYRVIVDQCCHDVRLVGTNGVFPSNRTALFQSSAYFRRVFTDQRTTVEFHEDVSVQALTTVVSYLLTGTYCKPATFSAHVLEEMITLIRRYRPAQIRALHQSMERSAADQLVVEQDSLEQVIKWYVTACESDMYRLENVALALLLTKHHNDLLFDYIHAEPTKPHLRELHEKLHRRRGVFRTVPVQKFIRAREHVVRHYELTESFKKIRTEIE